MKFVVYKEKIHIFQHILAYDKANLMLQENHKMTYSRDAIIGYATDKQAFFIRLFENDQAISDFVGLYCQDQKSREAESIMLILSLKRSFWLNGWNSVDILNGLKPL